MLCQQLENFTVVRLSQESNFAIGFLNLNKRLAQSTQDIRHHSIYFLLAGKVSCYTKARSLEELHGNSKFLLRTDKDCYKNSQFFRSFLESVKFCSYSQYIIHFFLYQSICTATLYFPVLQHLHVDSTLKGLTICSISSYTL